MPKILLIVHQT